MLRRWLINVGVVILLLICLSIIAIAARSYRRATVISHVRNVRDPKHPNLPIVIESSGTYFTSGLGYIYVEHRWSNLRFGGFIVADGFQLHEFPPDTADPNRKWLHQRNAAFTEWRHAGIHFRSEWATAGFGGWDLQFPWGYIVVPMAILSFTTIALRLRAWRRARAGKAGCPTCGYNLTANTSGICPECGTAVADKSKLIA